MHENLVAETHPDVLRAAAERGETHKFATTKIGVRGKPDDITGTSYSYDPDSDIFSTCTSDDATRRARELRAQGYNAHAVRVRGGYEHISTAKQGERTDWPSGWMHKRDDEYGVSVIWGPQKTLPPNEEKID